MSENKIIVLNNLNYSKDVSFVDNDGKVYITGGSIKNSKISTDTKKKYRYEYTLENGEVVTGYTNELDVDKENGTIKTDRFTMFDCEFE